jgi:hypothetical protein
MNTATRIRQMLTIAALAMLVGVSAEAAITVLNTDSAATDGAGNPGDFSLAAGVYSYSFNAGATSEMLVVGVSVEKGGGAWTVSYDGTAMTQAVQSSSGSGAMIFYLANPSASGTIEVDFSAVSPMNGFGIGIASLYDAVGAIELHSVAFDNGTTSIGITTAVPDTFVMVAGDANAVGGITMNAPLTTIGTQVDVGSSQAGFGYENAVPANAHTYSWTPSANARGIVAAAFVAPPITKLNETSYIDATAVGGGRTETLSFDAGASADKLVVELSSEKSGEAYSVSYNGDAMTLAIAGDTGRSADIWYLDNPHTGGAANIVVDMSGVGVVNGVGIAAVSLSGTAPGVAATAVNFATSVSITPVEADSFVVAGYVDNGNGGAIADSPLIHIYGGTIGSAKGAAGCHKQVSTATTYTFSGSSTTPRSVAAAFSPASPATVVRFR